MVTYVYVVRADDLVCEVFTTRLAADEFVERNQQYYASTLEIHIRELREF